MEQEISEVHGRLIRVQEEERSRIARELHDDINQSWRYSPLSWSNLVNAR